MTVQDVYDVLQGIAPFETQMDFDNAGLLVGSPWQTVTKIGVVLDVTDEAVDFALQEGIDCIVSHHPVIFSGVQSIPANSVLYRLIGAGISVISAHTNLDAAKGGVNDRLADALELEQVCPLGVPGETTPPMARVGVLPKAKTCRELADHINRKLKTRSKYVNTDREITTVALCGGAGADFLHPAVLAGADALITADVKHHLWWEAKKAGLMLVDAGHFETEQVVVEPLCELLQKQLDCPVIVIPQESPVCYQ